MSSFLFSIDPIPIKSLLTYLFSFNVSKHSNRKMKLLAIFLLGLLQNPILSMLFVYSDLYKTKEPLVEGIFKGY